MTVTVREYKKSKRVGFEVDIRIEWPGGETFRRRYRAPVSTKTQATAWGRAREVELITGGKDGELARSRRDKPDEKKQTPTLATFWPRFIKGHCVANRHKPSSIERKESAFRTWLSERLGTKRLDEIGPGEISDLKTALSASSAKTANNVLTSLSACLKYAGPEGVRGSEGLGIIQHVPRIRLLPADSDDVPEWYEEPDCQRIALAAERSSPTVHVMVLLACDAGARKAELVALKWSDLDMKRRKVHLQRSIWEGPGGERHETTPKGGRGRTLDMTDALHAALVTLPRHLGKERVLYTDDGRELTDRIVQRTYSKVQKDAGLEVSGGIHRLRHTFVSRLVAAGVDLETVRKMAGHANITTTQRYAHAAPERLTSAIRLLDRARASVGEALEKAGGA